MRPRSTLTASDSEYFHTFLSQGELTRTQVRVLLGPYYQQAPLDGQRHFSPESVLELVLRNKWIVPQDGLANAVNARRVLLGRIAVSQKTTLDDKVLQSLPPKETVDYLLRSIVDVHSYRPRIIGALNNSPQPILTDREEYLLAEQRTRAERAAYLLLLEHAPFYDFVADYLSSGQRRFFNSTLRKANSPTEKAVLRKTLSNSLRHAQHKGHKEKYQAALLLVEDMTSTFLEHAADIVTDALPVQQGVMVHRALEQIHEVTEIVISSNRGLPKTVVRSYVNSLVDEEDLLAAADLGLIRSWDKFDHTRGYKFSTYAMRWILQSLDRYNKDKGNTIRVPVHLVTMHNKIRRATQEYQQKHHAEPTPYQIEFMTGLPVRTITAFLQRSSETISLDTPEIEELNLHERIEDLAASDQFREEMSGWYQQRMQQVIREALTPREYFVLRERLGLQTGIQRTLFDVGQECGITRERVRQIEKKALLKLRTPPHATRLRQLSTLIDMSDPYNTQPFRDLL